MQMMLLRERAGIEKRFYDLCSEVVCSLGLLLYDLEYNLHGNKLCLYILDEETNSALIDDCVRVDRALSPYFEDEEWIPDSITLEVSSPGVYRSLKTREHFRRVIGKNIMVTLLFRVDKDYKMDDSSPVPRKLIGSRKFKSELLAVTDEGIRLRLDGGGTLTVDFKDIKKANLEV